MPQDVRVCSVCAWRETCQKRFITPVEGYFTVHCPDYTRDVRIKDGELDDKVAEYHWERWRKRRPERELVVTVSRQAGAGGSEIARRIAAAFGMDLVGREIIEGVAKSAKMNVRMVELLDEKAVGRIDSLITSLFVTRHLTPDMYFRHLTQVVAAIGERGGAVIVGRGAHLILPKERTVRLRFIAAPESRIRHFMTVRQMTRTEARQYIKVRDADRRGFIRRYFRADADDPADYDLVVNTGDLGIDGAFAAVSALIRQRIETDEAAPQKRTGG